MTDKREAEIRRLLFAGLEPCPHCGTLIGALSPAQLRQRRLRLGVSLREVARKAGFSAAYVSDVELGRRGLSLDLADRLLRAMGDTGRGMPAAEADAVEGDW